MSDRKRYWERRLGGPNDRTAWFEDLKRRHLFSEVAATDMQCRSDELRTHYMLGQRSIAVLEFEEATRFVPTLVAMTFTEALTPPPRQEKPNDGSSSEP